MTSEQFFGLIPAAGAGERMGLATPKQYLELLGRPMLYHSVKALLADARIATVFVVLAPADQEFKRHPWGEFGERVAPLVLRRRDAPRQRAEWPDRGLVHARA